MARAERITRLVEPVWYHGALTDQDHAIAPTGAGHETAQDLLVIPARWVVDSDPGRLAILDDAQDSDPVVTIDVGDDMASGKETGKLLLRHIVRAQDGHIIPDVSVKKALQFQRLQADSPTGDEIRSDLSADSGKVDRSSGQPEVPKNAGSGMQPTGVRSGLKSGLRRVADVSQTFQGTLTGPDAARSTWVGAC